MFHYTNDRGYKGINSQPVWLFKASAPPGNHPKAAYFTTLSPDTHNLAKRLFIRGSVEKSANVFSFSGGEDLISLEGGRGEFIFYSKDDYLVERERQLYRGLRADWIERNP